MITLVSGATLYPRGNGVGHLVVPKSWNKPEALGLTPGEWAMDNGAFAGFDPGAFLRMLEAFAPYRGELFVTAPDVVADAAATFALWPFWSRLLIGIGRTPAYVIQDGLTPSLLPDAPVIFVGGSTEFKESDHARLVCEWAKKRGKWVHWGRVNSKRRYELARKAGADSIDGTGFSMFPDKRIPLVAEWETSAQRQPELWGEGAA